MICQLPCDEEEFQPGYPNGVVLNTLEQIAAL
jgi:hypothetical protein